MPSQAGRRRLAILASVIRKSATIASAYTVDVDRITEAQTWVVVFRQAISLLSEYAARTGDDYNFGAALLATRDLEIGTEPVVSASAD